MQRLNRVTRSDLISICRVAGYPALGMNAKYACPSTAITEHQSERLEGGDTDLTKGPMLWVEQIIALYRHDHARHVQHRALTFAQPRVPQPPRPQARRAFSPVVG